ncbi:MAG: hypothetical protein IJM30_08375 [Thermoguttaceae bacterium]|nr:hypothetical protein [Thermoguttaceae bacterium]
MEQHYSEINACGVARGIMADWPRDFLYCPKCGGFPVSTREYVYTFHKLKCLTCDNGFEVISQFEREREKLVWGEYWSIEHRFRTNDIYDLLVLAYSETTRIIDLSFVPRVCLDFDSLGKNGVAAVIDLAAIPSQGKINLYRDGLTRDKSEVVDCYKRANFLFGDVKESKGWLMDVLYCAECLGKKEFALSELYKFVDYLKQRRPNNKNIEAKIRQQLQILRDKKYLEFTTRGNYRLLR